LFQLMSHSVEYHAWIVSRKVLKWSGAKFYLKVKSQQSPEEMKGKQRKTWPVTKLRIDPCTSQLQVYCFTATQAFFLKSIF
jgi:hypothetical protein